MNERNIQLDIALVELYENGAKYGLIFTIDVLSEEELKQVLRNIQDNSATSFFKWSGGSFPMITLTLEGCHEYFNAKSNVVKYLREQQWKKWKSKIRSLNPFSKFHHPVVSITVVTAIASLLTALLVGYYALSDSPSANRDFEIIKTYLPSIDFFEP